MTLSPAKISLILKLLSYPYILKLASHSREPHRLTNFIEDISTSFHSFWNKGNADENLRFIIPVNVNKTIARLALARSVATVISSGLAVMGVEPVEEMR